MTNLLVFPLSECPYSIFSYKEYFYWAQNSGWKVFFFFSSRMMFFSPQFLLRILSLNCCPLYVAILKIFLWSLVFRSLIMMNLYEILFDSCPLCDLLRFLICKFVFYRYLSLSAILFFIFSLCTIIFLLLPGTLIEHYLNLVTVSYV